MRTVLLVVAALSILGLIVDVIGMRSPRSDELVKMGRMIWGVVLGMAITVLILEVTP